jgi:hypothetical protein
MKTRWRLAMEEASKKYREAVGNPEPKYVIDFVSCGHTFSEAAHKFNITRNQVAGYVYRARRQQAS